jgi:hypothetical protein
MYVRTLHNASHTRKLIITPKETSGWDVREEMDSTVVRDVHYDDWHRVERARRTFALEAVSLSQDGWVET